MDEVEPLLRKWRKKPLWSLVEGGSPWQQLDFGQRDLESLLPHRSPFLLCDNLLRFTSLGLEGGSGGLLVGGRTLDLADPVFAGHFPGSPIYPGVLQLEMVGQVALCLGYFQKQWARDGAAIPRPEKAQTLNIRASKVLGAHYLAPIRPGQFVELQTCELGQSDGFFARMLGQVVLDNKVAMVCVQEVCFVED